MSVFDSLEGSSLPKGFRGYKSEVTDELLIEVERGYRAVVSERDAMRTRLEAAGERIAELERELVEHRQRSEAVSGALVRAAQVEEDSRRLVEAIKADAERQAEATRARARLDAEALMRDAQSIADRFVAEAERGLKEQRLETEAFLGEAKARLSSLVEDLLDQVTNDPGASAPGPESSAHAPRVRPAPVRESSSG